MYHTNLLKIKTLTCIVVLITTIQVSFAQSYYHSPNDSIVAHANYDDVGVFNIMQIHPTNDTLVFKWKKLRVDMPVTWEASICDFGHCYATVVDSSTMDSVVVGDNGLISLHLNPHVEAGTGIIQVTISANNTPTKIDTLTWIIIANGSTGISNISLQEQIQVYPNPTSENIHIYTPFKNGFHYIITNSIGVIVFTGVSKLANTQIALNNLSNGNYQITVYEANIKRARKTFLLLH